MTMKIDKPFHHIGKGTWLKDHPEQDVYKLLIDAYRLRVLENFRRAGGQGDNIYGAAPDGRDGFLDFLHLAHRQGLLPEWFSNESEDACLAMGLSDNYWSSLAGCAKPEELNKHYGDPLMSMQLRLFVDQVYGPLRMNRTWEEGCRGLFWGTHAVGSGSLLSILRRSHYVVRQQYRCSLVMVEGMSES